MWEWREDTGTAAGPREPRRDGWRLDHYGTWVWDPRHDDPRLDGSRFDDPRFDGSRRQDRRRDEPRRDDPRRDALAAQRAARVERLRPAMATLPPAPELVGAPVPRGADDWEPTPIFRSVASDRDRRLRPVEPEARRGQGSAPLGIPEPHPGSGPLPVQEPRERRGRLAPVETVPPPEWNDVPAASPEDELRRRAERRRRPRREHGGSEHREHREHRGRHALRAVPADDRGRHSFR